MFKKIAILVLFLSLIYPVICFAQESSQTTVQGVIEEVAEDDSYIVIGGEKILLAPELLKEDYLEAGDEVEVIVEMTDEGLKAISYDYILQEETAPDDLEEDSQESISGERG